MYRRAPQFHIHRAYAGRHKQHIPYTAKLSRLCTRYTIHWKTFAVHHAVAIMYCTQQMIRGENFRDRLKNRKKTRKFSHSKVLPYTVVVRKDMAHQTISFWSPNLIIHDMGGSRKTFRGGGKPHIVGKKV